MEFQEVSDFPDRHEKASLENKDLERLMKQTDDVHSGTFRYSDANLGGEVRTSTDNPDSAQSIARAEVFRRDGSSNVVGTARYSIAGGEAKLYGGSVVSQDFGTDDALLSEIGDQARGRGIDRLSVYVPDNDQAAADRWSRQGFQPRNEQDSGLPGQFWEKRL